jgi:hypothetical protein
LQRVLYTVKVSHADEGRWHGDIHVSWPDCPVPFGAINDDSVARTQQPII